MKLIILAAALMLGGTAVAQTPDTTTPPAGGSPCCIDGQPVAPDNSNPEHDARGIAVISAPAVAPSGYNQPARMVPAGTPTPTVAPPAPTSAGPLPPCSRTVTDRCTQTYERGRAD
ncbi:MAG TPA: hypothetical protein VFZ91_03180 [Allosphingosinicella sp.]